MPEKAAAVGKSLADLEAEEGDESVQYLGLIRAGQRLPAGAHRHPILAGDILVVQAGPEAIENVGALGLTLSEDRYGAEVLKGQDLELMEVVVPEGAVIDGRSAIFMPSPQNLGVRLLGLSRQGKRFRQRIRR